MSKIFKPCQWRRVSWGEDKSTRQHIKEIGGKLDKLETILFDLMRELGYSATAGYIDAECFEVKKFDSKRGKEEE